MPVCPTGASSKKPDPGGCCKGKFDAVEAPQPGRHVLARLLETLRGRAVLPKFAPSSAFTRRGRPHFCVRDASVRSAIPGRSGDLCARKKSRLRPRRCPPREQFRGNSGCSRFSPCVGPWHQQGPVRRFLDRHARSVLSRSRGPYVGLCRRRRPKFAKRVPNPRKPAFTSFSKKSIKRRRRYSR